ncbi:putative neprosin [Medicago truncatula]|uniref:Putative neprosin n=1 Tax=Medicago truncatula TaxID=3880 RepID=A0A396GKK3_MEDTR|nr:putative neprosin [Medicago truncatula]
MDFSSSIISLLLHFLLISSLVCPINSSETIQQINKPAIKTIQISDGDIIDCILTHKQPAFDHPLLKGQKPLDPPERSKGHNQISNLSDIFQLWSLSGESCPEGTIPIRRTTEEDISRAGSIDSFGRKANGFRTDTIQNGHLHSVGFVRGDIYYGAQAIINVWAPHVESPNEFSLGQIWIVSGSGKDLNTIEVSAGRYGDNRPRLFTFWTADGYDQTGCYDLLCPGFVQTNNKFAIGTPISPISTYNGGQYEITLFIFKVIFYI